MKKVLVMGLCCLCFCGCGEKKRREKIDPKIESYLQENMPFGYMYNEDKVNVVNSHLTIYQIRQKDWLDCAFFAESALESLLKKDISEIKIDSITFICKPYDLDGKAIGSVQVDNLNNFNIDDFPNNVTISNENDEVSENDLEIFKQSNSAKEARDKINEIKENEEKEKKEKEEQEAKEKAEKEQEEYKDKCKSYEYKEIFRNSGKYIGEYAKFTGKVIQVQENGEIYSLRVNVTKDKYGYYDDTVMIIMYMSAIEGRVLEDDIIEFYGTLGELTSYETVLGATVTIPTLYAKYAYLKS